MMAHFAVTEKSGECRGKKILVAGLGNELLRDDGVGPHAIRELQKSDCKDALVVEVGTAFLDALHLFEEADKIIAIDAMQAGGAPGTVYSLSMSDIEELQMQTSLHQMSLLEALKFLPSGSRPEVTILGVEPREIDYGLDLSADVRGALPLLVGEVHRLIALWKEETVSVE